MQNVKRTARETLEAMLDSGELSNTAWGLVSQNADDTMAEAARGLIEREPFEYMSETYCEIVLAHIAEYGNPTEIADPAASGDMVIVESVKPVTSTTAESLAVLQAIVREQERRAAAEAAKFNVGDVIRVPALADGRRKRPYCMKIINVHAGAAGSEWTTLYGVKMHGDGTATRRAVRVAAVVKFAECEIVKAAEPEVQYVTVTDEQGVIWHLTDADGQPVAAGEYTAKDGDRFTIAERPEAYFGLGVNEAPRTVDITWQTIAGKPRSRRQSGVFGAYVDMIVDGWCWKRADA